MITRFGRVRRLPTPSTGAGGTHLAPDSLSGDELHVEAVHQYALADLVVSPTHAREQEVVEHRHEALCRESRRNNGAVLLGDAALDHAVEHIVGEPFALWALPILE